MKLDWTSESWTQSILHMGEVGFMIARVMNEGYKWCQMMFIIWRDAYQNLVGFEALLRGECKVEYLKRGIVQNCPNALFYIIDCCNVIWYHYQIIGYHQL
jgi:hypothetical protein